ncbi:MAG TPA: hypothetical protein VM513_16605 [Kofleriaceae bacterium]|nr:hypothetical protein [Kofleriaceae bacterium]
MKTTMLAAVLLASTAGLANAGGSEGSVGAGVEFNTSGFGGPSLNYDAGKFHVGGFLAIDDPAGDDNTDFALGGRFYYHVHSTAMSDFSVGLGVAYVSDDDPLFMDRASLFFIEPGIQLRAFIASNVALSISAGLPIGLADADGVALTGQFNGLGGVHYYFF